VEKPKFHLFVLYLRKSSATQYQFGDIVSRLEGKGNNNIFEEIVVD